LIDEHIKSIENNLKNVEGLTRAEILSIVNVELKDLMAYIPKSI
jgi:hypothetical protein